LPIYDYICGNCRHRIEVIHGIHADGPRFCPSCGAEGTMTKAMTTPAVHFKGSGWAKKDRSSTSGSRTKASSASSTSDAAGATGSSDPAASTPGGESGGASSSTDAAKPAPTSED
jgi:putative FmdB family regulatory protein